MQKKENDELKRVAKQAKSRLAKGYWGRYYDSITTVKASGETNTSKIVSYYYKNAKNEVFSSNLGEEFYKKVKEYLQTFGEAGNAIGYLTDKAYYDTLGYDEKQKYVLELSEAYHKAVERYRAESAVEKMKAK